MISCTNEFQEVSKASNLAEYGDKYQQLKWLSVSEAEAWEATRNKLLFSLQPHVQYSFKQTKLDCTSLSTGCRACGGGEWSCLFINGKCNCRCFYCPTPQDQIGIPTTNGIQFHKPADYADYAALFKFRGVSISGGEPLLTVDTSLKYISAVRKKLGDSVYIWLYTNGTLSSKSILSRLRDAGLNEIRFDIGATHYALENAKEAVGIIPVVTVEIPAIPEDKAIMKEKLVEMSDIGISHLNLHQLRLTPFNFEKIKTRNYTFLHGEKVTVLESELTALELMAFSFEKQIALPINYCTFHYKRSFQGSAARKRSAGLIMKPYESMTEKGYIRSLCLTGSPDALQAQADRFAAVPDSTNLWQLTGGHDRLYFNSSLFDAVDTTQLAVKVTYYEPRILSAMTYRNAFVQLPINKRKSVVVEKAAVCEEFDLNRDNQTRLRKMIVDSGMPPSDESCDTVDRVMEKIFEFEIIRPGLQPYF